MRSTKNPMEAKKQETLEITEMPSEPSRQRSESAAAAPPVKPITPTRERRRKPLSSQAPTAPVPPPRLADYASIIGNAELDELRFLAGDLRGKTVKMVNSTAVGGGVAEILNRLVPLLDELEIPTHWEVITGGNDFFEVTKAMHNALHRGQYVLTPEAQEIFIAHNEQNRARLRFDEDIVVIHDPQPLGLVA